MALIDVITFGDPAKVAMSYFKAVAKMPEVFLGVTNPKNYPSWYLSIISITKLVTMGIFHVHNYQKI